MYVYKLRMIKGLGGVVVLFHPPFYFAPWPRPQTILYLAILDSVPRYLRLRT